ncbi:FMN-binding domain-containing protein [Thermocrinis minervae]|uniref:FMN-binding domain-containing protein n=2 Tax=Thermocrinis minervae TaxID=381751 RepID=A0A1M6S438_9AQUI|nr:FMN-binding domain-containing protein [Thermocrinis minervae]
MARALAHVPLLKEGSLYLSSMCRCWFLLIVLIFFSFGGSREFQTLDRALAQIFPGAKVEVKNVVLTPEQVNAIEEASKVKLNSRLISWYIAKRNGQIVGYAYVDVHTVRTHPETVLYALDSKGRILAIEVLSFNEPLEYMPDEEWLRQFKGKSGADPVRLKKDVINMTGATLTSRAITDNARKVLHMWKVLFGGAR